MAKIQRTVADVPPDQVAIQKALLEADDFVVEEKKQTDGNFTLIGTKDDGSS
jgi:hypothetical protein